jgi:hypothetical protein
MFSREHRRLRSHRAARGAGIGGERDQPTLPSASASEPSPDSPSWARGTRDGVARWWRPSHASSSLVVGPLGRGRNAGGSSRPESVDTVGGPVRDRHRGRSFEPPYPRCQGFDRRVRGGRIHVLLARIASTDSTRPRRTARYGGPIPLPVTTPTAITPPRGGRLVGTPPTRRAIDSRNGPGNTGPGIPESRPRTATAEPR